MQEKDILKEFKKVSKDIWKDSPMIDKIDINVKIRKQGYMMSLGYTANPIARPRAIGSSLVRVPTKMSLYISEEAMKLPKPQFQQLLRHEAIHMGYPRHDVGFRNIAKKHNIPMTFSQSEGGEYMVQVKEGSRYSTVESFPSLEGAKEFAHKLFESKKYERIRIRY